MRVKALVNADVAKLDSDREDDCGEQEDRD